MKIAFSKFVIVIFLVAVGGLVNANPGKLRSEIEAVNRKTEQLYIAKNAAALVDLYSDDLTFFPENHTPIFGKQRLENFMASWFKSCDIKSYKKTVYEVQSISDHIFEIGTFTMDFETIPGSPSQLTGKYMIAWVKDKKGKLVIKSEAFGADKWVEPRNMPYAGVPVGKAELVEERNISAKIRTEVEDFNAIVIKAVAEGDWQARAKGFTEDGVQMPPFGPVEVGMKEIEEHMRKTYNPDISFIVKHNYNRIYDLGDYVFVNGHYSGKWGDEKNGGKFEGNMSNLMKRQEDGKLLMYRQLGNREP